MARENPRETICRYLQDTIAAEKNFESQLRQFASEGDDRTVRSIFAEHADETHSQYERLTARLESLGERPSAIKSFLAHMFGMTPKAAQIGHDESERTTQNLIIACAAEGSEIAMYEALTTAASAAGDDRTETLAREIQQEERRALELVQRPLSDCARRAATKVSAEGNDREVLANYLEDTIAAETNFESLLTSFSKTGRQDTVQDLFSKLSWRAKKQHERLTARLNALGGSKSAAKSALAHMLGFAPAVAQAGHEPEEKNTQNLIMTCAAASGEIGMYEALAAAASVCSDPETERLAKELQKEESDDWEMTWALLPGSARDAFYAVTGTKRGAA